MQEWQIYWIIFRRTVCEKTHSSHCKSRVSLTLSLKQPSEYMLSNTSGSSSVRDKIRLTHTRLGGGCSGHGSLRPPLEHTHMQEITRVINILTIIIEIVHESLVWRGKHLLTDTRHVSGWPLAVRGDTDALYAWWLQSPVFNVHKTALFSEQGNSD